MTATSDPDNGGMAEQHAPQEEETTIAVDSAATGSKTTTEQDSSAVTTGQQLSQEAVTVEQEQKIATEVTAEQECGTMMEQLAPELMVCILGYLDVRDRVILASCSPTLAKRVYDDCPQAWTIISFGKVMPSCRQRLTDGNLAKLLSKVHAKTVTKKLSLSGCSSIRGYGLMPIQCSAVLETVNLRGTCAKKNLTPFLYSLETLLPFQFRTLFVDYKIFDLPPKELKDFLWKLREANLLRASHSMTLCTGCHEPVVDASRQIIPNKLGPPEPFCYGCAKPFCRKGSCPVSVHECSHCNESYCHDCNTFVEQCGFCGVSHCKVDSCGGKFDVCHSCGKICCTAAECRGKIVNCDYCKKRKTCLDCANYDICTEDCTVCVTCQAKGNCSACKGQFCIQCIRQDVRQCEKCRLVFCDKPACTSLVEHCKASVCNLIHCKQCKDFEFCITCDRSFCADHGRLVECFECDEGHCRTCYKKRCQWCLRPCYEDCFCADLHQPASKKAKTSP